MSILAAFMVPHPPMIVPAVGRGSEAQIAKTVWAYEAVAAEIADLQPDTIVITSPHAVMYADYFHISPGKRARGSFSDFRAKEVRFEETYDEELVREICSLADGRDFPAGTLGERESRLDHGTMVPLWFIRKEYEKRAAKAEAARDADGPSAEGSRETPGVRDFRIVRAGLSGLPLTKHYEFGMLIREAAESLGRRVVFVGSGDLSHKLQSYGPYGYAPEGPEYDARIMDVCGRAAFGELFDFSESFCEKAAECGHRSFVIMAGALDGTAVAAKAYSHQDVTGVGYGICSFYPKGEDAERHFLKRYLENEQSERAEKLARSDPYVKLAYQTLDAYLKRGEFLSVPGGLPAEMTERRAGAFVSLHEHGRLRGCIGTTAPTTDSVAEEIIQNAVSAATQDPRFDPVDASELPYLEISVDVLGEPEAIASVSELDVKKYGVIVSCGRRRGLLLPDLEGVDTPKQQVAIAMRKGGIREGETVRLERFEVVRHV